MAIDTAVYIEEGYYGKYRKTKKGDTFFTRIGKALVLSEILESVEDGTVSMELQFEYGEETKQVVVSRKEVFDPKLIGELVAQGADIPQAAHSVFLDSIRLQEEKILETSGKLMTYQFPGWITINVPDPNDQAKMVKKLCYRSSTLIGGKEFRSVYQGCLNLDVAGTREAYFSMLEREVIGHVPLEYVFLMSAAAVVVGLCGEDFHIENPIIHLCGKSGTGKTTAAKLAASVFGSPATTIPHESSSSCGISPILGTWGATENATIRRCQGNFGVVIIFNELGKFTDSDLTSVVYKLSEGDDKDRYRKDLKLQEKLPYRTTILSNGEISLLDSCKSKVEGLSIRVLEIEEPLTIDAAHSDRIIDVVSKNHGFLGAMLAKGILKNGGKEYVLEKLQRFKTDLIPQFEDSILRERFVGKFVATALVTAEILSEVTSLNFSTKKLFRSCKNNFAKCKSAFQYQKVASRLSWKRYALMRVASSKIQPPLLAPTTVDIVAKPSVASAPRKKRLMANFL